MEYKEKKRPKKRPSRAMKQFKVFKVASHTPGVQRERRGGESQKKIIEEIIAKMSPNLMKNIKPQVKSHSRRNMKKKYTKGRPSGSTG